ncbi:hypothetical protein Ana3638_09060 [Anaerocolumna sedimenticola]|uniref:Uncharacterized protein n=1 Tax=Anaerocolumna sedimenticola TaxID=2696063 RepID=A0A6P1TNG5_9FIRM|nr:hypothetical protein [Anaerocolumna sedimenticola]QHQ60898.1 hypothetical protein Ana3638_09060 [Anaerocolumna sedimenticola]
MSQKMSSNEYLLHVLNSGHKNPFVKKTLKDFHAAYYEVVKLELKLRGLESEDFCYEHLSHTLNRLKNRQDMAEFGIPSLVRILKEYRHMLPSEIISEIEETLTGFRYWLDEPGEIHACYFSENHQPLYHSGEYLAGSLFPDTTFPSNGKSGEWHKQHAYTYLNRWMDWRIKFGFSEWCTNYYAEDMIALLGIYYYAEDVILKKKAGKLINTLLLEIALNSFRGQWIGTHGRTYTHYVVEPAFDSISPICRMYWGEGNIDGDLADCAIMLAVYQYECPEEIVKIALDKPSVMINKERMGINTADARYYGIDPADFDNIMFFWGNQTFDAKEVIENSTRVIKPSNWMNERINAYKEKYKLCDMAGIPYDPDPDFTALTQADIYTYRTPDYGLSCAQDYRKGKQGYQQMPWGATLGGRAVVFTNHPGSQEFEDRPNLIAGNWILPRAAQHENVLLCIYRIPADCIRMLETHAYFPQHEFDEVAEQWGWIFGKKESAYIALRSLVPAHWKEPDPALYKAVYKEEWESYWNNARPYFYHANGHANIWITELGSQAQNGSFSDFINQFENAALTGDTFHFTYHSPSQGTITFGWNLPLMINGKEIIINNYDRYDNPYLKEAFYQPR